ncbi:MAG: hypothetical protein GY777_32440, partial [Candidatus Brocadiaceae bacterium]|nr:hypothetical protein [Candidatus Brocadiaceae bacterium]
ETVHEIKETKNKKLDVTSIKSISVPLKVGFRLIDPETENLINVRLFGGIDGSHILSIDHTEKSGDIDDIDTDDFSNLILSRFLVHSRSHSYLRPHSASNFGCKNSYRS